MSPRPEAPIQQLEITQGVLVEKVNEALNRLCTAWNCLFFGVKARVDESTIKKNDESFVLDIVFSLENQQPLSARIQEIIYGPEIFTVIGQICTNIHGCQCTCRESGNARAIGNSIRQQVIFEHCSGQPVLPSGYYFRNEEAVLAGAH
jgi:hypothetical protein